MSDTEQPARPFLRLIKTPELKLRRYELDPDVKAMFDDMRRQREERKRKRDWCDCGGNDAA